MFTSEIQIRVRYAETDQMGVVYHGHYAQYFETARAEIIRKLGYTYRDMEDTGIIMPVVELHIKFIRPAHYDELLTVKVILKELPVHHRVEFYHEIFNEKQVLLTVGKVVLYFLDKTTLRKTNMPESLAEKLAPYFTKLGDGQAASA